MHETMLAARLHAIGDFRIDRVNIPEPEKGELLVRVLACGVCGSDLPRVFQNGSSNHRYPLTIGHEFSGEVVAEGPEADPALIGRRGAFFPLIPCMSCDSCLAGDYAMCEHYDYMGSRRDGGFAEYVLVPSAWNFVPSDNPEISDETLAMTEPACVAQHAIRRGGTFPGAAVLIFGAGPIGIMAARWARIFGASQVFMVDVDDSRVAYAEEKGFPSCNSRKEDPAAWLRAKTGGRLADICIEGTGFGQALENAIFCTKRLGTIVLLGNPAVDTTFSREAHSQILRRELMIRGIWNSHYSNVPINEWAYTIREMDAGEFICDDLISHRISLAEVPDYIEKMYRHEIRTMKVMYCASAGETSSRL